MRLPEYCYLIRHGYNKLEGKGEHLSDLGRRQATEAGIKLQQEGFDDTAVILASTAPRCMETAQTIAGVLMLQTEIIFSECIERMNDEDCLKDIREVIDGVAQGASLEFDSDDQLAIVGHGPMIQRELIINHDRNASMAELNYGAVYKIKT